jgi:Mce-associated membrane protein
VKTVYRRSNGPRHRMSEDESMPIEEHGATIEADSSADETEPDADQTEDGAIGQTSKAARRIDWPRLMVYVVVPAAALLLALAAGFLKWQDSTARDDATARIESARAAKDSTIALLSYQPNTVEQQLGAARDLVTGDFRDAYTQLTHDVVIPGAKQKQISAAASVPAVASVYASEKHAVAMVFVNQTTVFGADPPSASTSTVRVTLDKVDGRWLISQFDPV